MTIWLNKRTFNLKVYFKIKADTIFSEPENFIKMFFSCQLCLKKKHYINWLFLKNCTTKKKELLKVKKNLKYFIY